MSRLASTFAVLALVAGCASALPPKPGVIGPVDDDATEQLHRIPVTDARGERRLLYSRACFPAGRGPFRLASINHGSPPGGADKRAVMEPKKCDSEVARWFLERGYAVVFALRRGYGETGGAWDERYGRCEDPDYARAGLETARDYDAVVSYATSLPRVRPDGAVVVGVSAGGWGTVAYDSRPHAKVAAFIDMAGGRGGHEHDVAGQNCRPEALYEAAARYGHTASTPMLWVYAANDSFFAPEIAARMHAAFVGAGGAAEIVAVGPFGKDGHALFGAPGGVRVWGPLFERYLAKQLGAP